MDESKVWGAVLYASAAIIIGVYVLLIDAGVLRDKTGKDEFYSWITQNRLSWLVIGLFLIGLGGFEFFRYIDSFSMTREECIRTPGCSL